jgi:hypothetical protein
VGAKYPKATGIERGVHWRIILPITMTALSAFLMLLAERQQPILWKMGTG